MAATKQSRTASETRGSECPASPHVLVAASNWAISAGLCAILTGAGITVVAQAQSEPEVLHSVRTCSPEVVLLEAALLDAGRSQLIAAIKSAAHQVAIVVLDFHDDLRCLLPALGAGATCYLGDGFGPEQVVATVRAAAAGNAVVDRELLLRALRTTGKRQRSGAEANPDAIHSLSQRERQVLACLAEGMTNRQVAERLGLKPGTVRAHVYSIYNKLGVNDRVQASVLAIQGGLSPGHPC